LTHHVMDLPSGWSLHRDDEARPLLVHIDGRRLEPAQAVDLECADRLYVELKLEHDRLQRTYDGIERTPGSMAIWSAYAVIGFFRLKKRKEQRLIREKPKPRSLEVDDQGQVYDLKGNPIDGMFAAPPLEEDEEPEDFLDKELNELANAQQLERSKRWEKSAI